MSHKVYLFNMYSLIQECYYQTTCPPPVSLVERLYEGIMLLVDYCRRGCKTSDRPGEDSFSKYGPRRLYCLDRSRLGRLVSNYGT